MSNKLVWGSNGTATYLASLDPASLRAELVDFGYDEEMLNQLTGEELRDILDEGPFWELDSEDFDLDIEPMINKQTCDGIVLMFGEAKSWDGARQAGRAVFTEHLKGGDIDPDVYEVEIIDDGEGLVWLGHHHDATHVFKLYALPEENQVDFIENCMEDAIEDQFNWYYSDDNFEEAKEEIIENILAQFTDLDFLNDNINFSQVPNYCKPIKNLLLNESLNESKDDIVTITVDAVLEDDIDLENIKVFDIEPEYSWNKAFDNLKLTGTKENIIKYLKSDLYNADNEWIKEYYPELLEEVNEAASKEPKKLAKELKEIKKLSNEYGREYFTVMPFTSFDNDPDSIELRYPEFFRIVKAFFKEMEIADKEQLADNDYLDMLWDVNISQHDWDTIIRVCEMIIERGTPIQFEKIYKNNFDDGLSDDQILADREKQDELAAQYEEALNENKGIIIDKVIVKTNEPGFISKKHELENQGYKLNGSGDGQLIYVKFEDDESLKEDVAEKDSAAEALANANKFLKYLQENDCATTGAFSEKPVEIEDHLTHYDIDLFSQAGSIRFIFYIDGFINVISDLDDEDIHIDQIFNDYNEFVKWYKEQEFTWTSDLGANLN